MKKWLRIQLSRFVSNEAGNALILVTLFLVLGSLTIVPVLSHIGTALKTGRTYEYKTEELYAADAGVEDAIWQIKYGGLEALYGTADYVYDFSTNCSYLLADPINDISTNITVQNIWIPKGVPTVNATLAREFYEDSNKLVIAGTASDNITYRIKVELYPDEGEEDDLLVKRVGIWLPHGFGYVNNSSSLATHGGTAGKFTENVTDHAGGQAVIWDFFYDGDTDSDNFTYFPGVQLEDNPQISEITFLYTADEFDTRPNTVSWIETTGTVSDLLPVIWDIDTKIFRVTSVAGNTEIEAYSSRCEMRQMESAIAGDYVATGASLMQDNSWPWNIRDTLLFVDGSYNIVNSIDDDADVLHAYLYWAGSYKESSFTQPIWYDDCSDLDPWIKTGNVWSGSSGRFRGRFEGGNEEDRYLEMPESVDLTGYTPGEVVVEWDQDEDWTLSPTDNLSFELSNDGGNTWSDMIVAFADDLTMLDYSEEYFYYILPEEYVNTDSFKMRFYLGNFNYDDYCYIDDFAVARIIATPDPDCKFWINDIQYCFDENGEATSGTDKIEASKTNVLGFKKRNEYSYACYRDVSKIVKKYPYDPGEEHHTGNAKYTVADVDADTDEYRSFAGWSLIIVYYSPETAGHQLYIFDEPALNSGNRNLDFDRDGVPGGTIRGFIIPEKIEGEGDEDNAATLTCFVGEGDHAYDGDYMIFNGQELSDGAGDIDDVWDSHSVDIIEQGVDIDTFDITWGSGLLNADDTEAHIDLPTGQDNWILIYMILSVRSKTYVSGTEHYMIIYG